MYIDHLCNHPEYIDIVSTWIHNEFVIKTKGSLNFKEVVEYLSNTNEKDYPMAFIALVDNACVGTVSIFENDLQTQKVLTPWLASLYVSPNHRGQGVGEMLISHVQDVVKRLGFENLYLRTEHTSEYYRRLGWEFVYKTEDEKGQETEVFKYKLK